MQDAKERGIMPPRWLMFPSIPEGSIGWRMGWGEYYSMDFHAWYYKLSKEEQMHFKELFPEPKSWMKSNLYKKDYFSTYFWQPEGKPEYGLGDLLKDEAVGQNKDYLYFWEHESKAGGEVTKACLSQWWPCSFYVGSTEFNCMEQYMMAEKARLFKDLESAKEIMKLTDPKAIKACGREIKQFDEALWNKVKYAIVLNGNYFKFMQNENLKQFLLRTQDKVLVEASPYDEIWGIKLSAQEAAGKSPKLWQGQNLLGFALMEVRKEISRVCYHQGLIEWEILRAKYGQGGK